MLGMIFDLDKSNVMRDIRYLEPAVKSSIPIPAKKYGRYKMYFQRYFCHNCNVTFNDKTGTIFHYSHISLSSWFVFRLAVLYRLTSIGNLNQGD